jgi:hypothetical protein
MKARVFSFSVLLLILSCGRADHNDPVRNNLAPPSLITAVPYDGKIVISWGYGSGAASTAVSYALYWSSRADAQGGQVRNIQSPYIHEGLTNGVTYFYSVTALDYKGESDHSLTTSATPLFGL